MFTSRPSSKYTFMDSQRGFTLLELLVVIAIIGILSSIALASLTVAREKARDATRFTMLREMRNAMELYFSDNGFYPQAHGISGLVGDGAAGELGLTVGNTPGMLQYYPQVPIDPLDPLAAYFYIREGNGYAIALVLEETSAYCKYVVNTSETIFDGLLGVVDDCL